MNLCVSLPFQKPFSFSLFLSLSILARPNSLFLPFFLLSLLSPAWPNPLGLFPLSQPARPASFPPRSLTARWGPPVGPLFLLEPHSDSSPSPVSTRLPACLGPHAETARSPYLRRRPPRPSTVSTRSRRLLPRRNPSVAAALAELQSTATQPFHRSPSMPAATKALRRGEDQRRPFFPLYLTFSRAQSLDVAAMPRLAVGSPLRSLSCRPESLDRFPVAPSSSPCKPRTKQALDGCYRPRLGSFRQPPQRNPSPATLRRRPSHLTRRAPLHVDPTDQIRSTPPVKTQEPSSLCIFANSPSVFLKSTRSPP